MTEYDTIRGKTILVTGGAGFIGSHLCTALVDSCAKVRCLDSFITGKQENIRHLVGHASFQLIEGDIRDEQTCLRATKGTDMVLHQAALGSVPRSVDDPATTTSINVMGSLNIFKACRDLRVNRIVYASSSSVYGDDTHSPKIEGQVGLPLSPYAASKKTVEMYANVFSALFGMQIDGLRYFNVFGPRQDPAGPYAAAIPRFLKAAIEKKPITVYGDGTQTRDFTHVSNVVHANLLAACSNSKSCSGIMNVACGEAVSVNDVIKVIGEQLMSRGHIDKLPVVHHAHLRPGEIKHSLASTSKITEILGFKPVCNFRRGLEAYVEWYVNSACVDKSCE